MSDFRVHLSGNPNVTTIRVVNVRNGPGTGEKFAVLFTSPVGTRGLDVLDVQPDANNISLNGKVYQWVQVRFPDMQVGWVRDDLIELEGDGTRFGYPVCPQPTYGFSLRRTMTTPPASATPTATTPTPAATTPSAQATPGIPAPVTPPTTPSPQAIPTVIPSGPPTGKIIGKTGVNLRVAPISGSVLNRLDYLTSVRILSGQPQGGTSNYVWAQVETPKGRGFVRADYLSITGDASAFGLSKGDEYPAPMKNYWWVRGFNVNQNPGESEHLGWDFGAAVGEPILAGPYGGVVVRTLVCTKCTADKPSSYQQGFRIGDAAVFNDEGWGFGYGNFVIVRYDNELLPQSTRDRLNARGLGGAHLFALYGHLASFRVAVGQTLAPEAVIGGCGNTGNSEAPHLHLEVRAGRNPNDNWSLLRSNLLDPGVLFLR
jgi:murein DD-endopeptidase MepM/ murein hydrolase activator NlpD